MRQRDTGEPQFEVVDPQPLALLPEPDTGDLFFDFEGDPLWTADGHDWGLEYLFGVLDATGGFHPLWAHDRVDERKALIDFLAMVAKRRKRRPNMHIYHYAPYEKTALLQARRTLRSRRGRGRRVAAQRNVGRPVSVGAQEHSRGCRVVQPQGARAALHGRAAARR